MKEEGYMINFQKLRKEHPTHRRKEYFYKEEEQLLVTGGKEKGDRER